MTSPEQTFKAGAVRASIFRNTLQRDGRAIPIRKVVLEVRYKDAAGNWKGSNSFSLNELPKAITALQQAYEYLLATEAELRQGAEPTPHLPLPLPAKAQPSGYSPSPSASGSGYPRPVRTERS